MSSPVIHSVPLNACERIPFLEAMTEARLFRKNWLRLSEMQRVILLAFYNETMTPAQEELYWATQGYGEFDELGFLVSTRTHPTRVLRDSEFREGWIIGGRRLGKTDGIASTIVAYEATCGGHEAYLRKRQRGICFQIAQDLRMARYSLHFIAATLEDSPLAGKLMAPPTADRIDLANQMSIYCVPPTIKSVRGFASPVAVLDENGVWWQEAENANPDYEVYRALSPAQMQFPHRKLLGISSPWNKAGLLWRNFEAGTEGRQLAPALRAEFAHTLVMHVPTGASGNPIVTREYLAHEQQKDPRAFERECLAVFQDSISGFLPASLLKAAISPGLTARAPQAGRLYVAAMDPAFRQDGFTFTIVHGEGSPRRLMQDVVENWTGTKANPLSPLEVLQEIARLCELYGVSVVYTDQYHLESLQQLALQCGISLMGLPFTPKNKAERYSNLKMLLAQQQLSLLDHPEQAKQLRMLERKLSSGGSMQISAPAGAHDDHASVLALAVSQAMWSGLLDNHTDDVETPPTLFQRGMASIAQKRGSADNGGMWDVEDA